MKFLIESLKDLLTAADYEDKAVMKREMKVGSNGNVHLGRAWSDMEVALIGIREDHLEE